MLGSSYLTGLGIAENPLLAEQWLSRAARGGSVEGAYLLGYLYYHGGGPVLVNLPEATRWLGKAALAGHEPSQLELGRALIAVEKSKPVGTRNYSEAVGLLQKVAQKGSTSAMIELGVFFANTGQNYPEASKWLRGAADKGSPTAAKMLQELARMSASADTSPNAQPRSMAINPATVVQVLASSAKPTFATSTSVTYGWKVMLKCNALVPGNAAVTVTFLDKDEYAIESFTRRVPVRPGETKEHSDTRIIGLTEANKIKGIRATATFDSY